MAKVSKGMVIICYCLDYAYLTSSNLYKYGSHMSFDKHSKLLVIIMAGRQFIYLLVKTCKILEALKLGINCNNIFMFVYVLSNNFAYNLKITHLAAFRIPSISYTKVFELFLCLNFSADFGQIQMSSILILLSSLINCFGPQISWELWDLEKITWRI